MITSSGRNTLRFPAQPHLKLDPGCVVSYDPIASSLGLRVLHDGGNAVDAAVATALALAVTYPQAGNIGGGGFMMIHLDGEVHMLDYRERAPARVDAALYDNEGTDQAKSALGALAVAVPGTIAGLFEAHERFGRRSWSEIVSLVAPLADFGVWLTARQSSAMRLYVESLKQFETTRKYFLEGTSAIPPGTRFVQTDLARTLDAIGADPRSFYEGRIAEQIVAEVKRGGGVLELDDMASYRPVWRTPLRRVYRGHDVYLPPLPSAGGLVASLALGCAQALGVEELAHGSPEWVLVWARIFRLAFSLGNLQSGDPDQLSAEDVERSQRLAQLELTPDDLPRLEAELLPDQLAGDAAAATRSSTTHFSIIDRDGMAVSNTYSVNTLFGSKLAVEGAGFLLNNTIADFRIASGPNYYGLLQGDRNRIAPYRRAASSMTPVMVLKDGEVEMVIGGSGGPRIPTAITHVIASSLGSGLSLSESVRRPRAHHQLFPDQLLLEKGIPKATMERLQDQGHPVSMVSSLGMIAAIKRRLDDNEISAVLDTRFGDFW